MKTIICPIDFSPSSDYVARFASLMATDTHARLILADMINMIKQKKVAVGADEYETDKLGGLHDLLKSIYHIPCTIDDRHLTGTVYKQLSTVGDDYDIMVLGMRTDLKEKSLIDLNKVVQEVLVPVYFVPDHFKYSKIDRLLYLYESKYEPEPPLMTLNWLAEWMNASLKFISFLPTDSSYKERDKLNQHQKDIRKQWHSPRAIDFETIVNDDPTGLMLNYTDFWTPSDLLVVSIDHPGIFERLWHRSIIKRMIKNAATPFIVVHR